MHASGHAAVIPDILDQDDEIFGELLNGFHLGRLRIEGVPVYRLPRFHGVDAVTKTADGGTIGGASGDRIVFPDGEIGGDSDDLGGLEMNDGTSAVARLEGSVDFDQ